MLRFRKVLRDSRVQALFASLGKLVPEPPPPTTPEEIRIALIQTDAEVHTRFATGNNSIAPLLKEGYTLYNRRWGDDDCFSEHANRPCESEGKQSVLEGMSAGR